MTIALYSIGKTDSAALRSLEEDYTKRLQHYVKLEVHKLPDVKVKKGTSENQQKAAEANLLLSHIQSSDRVILLDDKGNDYTSKQFAQFLQKQMNAGYKRLVLVVGGPYGFDETVYQRADGKLSLSRMTFTHQMVRIFLLEQVYRGFTILRNEPYHHE